jgi:CheY-like chemotaxis protein
MTTSILIVEDDDNKLAQVQQAIVDQKYSTTISFAKSFQSGLKALIAFPPDILILDMTLPTFDRGINDSGGRTRPFAGRDILEQLDRRGLFTRAIVVSGFEILGDGAAAMSLRELDQQLMENHKSLYLGFVYYSPSESKWRTDLADHLLKIMGPS